MAEKKEELFNALNVYREQGFDSLMKEQYKKAIEFFTLAYRIDTDDKRTIVGRSMGKSKFSQFDGSLYDAEMVLTIDENDIYAQFLKGQALYEMGEFEDGLVNFHIGWRRRKCPNLFEIGAMQAEETIEDCIGRNVGPALRDFSKTIQMMEERNRVIAGGRPLEDPEVMELRNRRIQKKQAKLDSIMCEKYLGRLAGDKKFLDKLKENPNLSSPNKRGSNELMKLVNSGADMLKQRQEILRTRMPFYAVKYHEATVSESLRQRKQYEFEMKQERAREEAGKMLQKMRQLRLDGSIKTFLDTFNLALEFFDKKSKKVLSRKREYVETLLNIYALKFLDERRLVPGKTQRDNIRLIYMFLGLPQIKEASYDGFLSLPAMPVLDVKNYLKTMDARLSQVDSTLERAWVYFELARFHLEINKIDLARMYAKKCTVEAKSINNMAWSINAYYLIAKCEISQRNKSEAKAALQEAYLDALKLMDESYARYLEQCIEESEAADYDDLEDDSIEQREKMIVRIMSKSELKGDMEYLFRRMSVAPANRRMSLMPGIKPQDKVGVVKTANQQSAVAQESPAYRRRSMVPPGTEEQKEV